MTGGGAEDILELMIIFFAAPLVFQIIFHGPPPKLPLISIVPPYVQGIFACCT